MGWRQGLLFEETDAGGEVGHLCLRCRNHIYNSRARIVLLRFLSLDMPSPSAPSMPQ